MGALGAIHGISAALKGFVPTDGFVMATVGAVTIIPNYLITGTAAICSGLMHRIVDGFLRPQERGTDCLFAPFDTPHGCWRWDCARSVLPDWLGSLYPNQSHVDLVEEGRSKRPRPSVGAGMVSDPCGGLCSAVCRNRDMARLPAAWFNEQTSRPSVRVLGLHCSRAADTVADGRLGLHERHPGATRR